MSVLRASGASVQDGTYRQMRRGYPTEPARRVRHLQINFHHNCPYLLQLEINKTITNFNRIYCILKSEKKLQKILHKNNLSKIDKKKIKLVWDRLIVLS